jgi:zinc-ribbon domain
VPYCTRCGTPHADDALFCPWCGQAVASTAQAGSAEPGERISGVIGRTLGRCFSRPGVVLLGIGALCMLVWLAALAAVILAGAWIVFGTVHPHAIVDTGCFVEHNDPLGVDGTRYTITPGCDVFRVHPSALTVTLTLLAAALLLAVIGSLLYLVVARAADRRFGSRTAWPLIPSAGSVLRALMRIIGWGIVLYAVFVAVLIAVIVGFIILAKVGSVVGVLIGIAACAYLLVWWAVPIAVRLELAFMRMVIDDRGLARSWDEVRPTMGQAWAFLGLTLAVSFGLSLAGNLATAAAGKLGVILAAPVQVISYTVQLVILIAVMRFLAGELATDEAEPAAPPA